MDFNRLTEKVQQALQAAQSKAVRLNNQQVDVEHLLAALIEQENGIAPSLLLRAGVAPDQIHRRVEQELERLPKVSSPTGASDQVYITGRLNRLFTEAEDQAKRLKDDFISVEHLLLAMTADSGFTGRLFKEQGLTSERLMKALQEVRGQPACNHSKSRRRRTKLSSATGATLPSSPRKANSTRLSDAMKRSVVSSKFSRGAPRIILS